MTITTLDEKLTTKEWQQLVAALLWKLRAFYPEQVIRLAPQDLQELLAATQHLPMVEVVRNDKTGLSLLILGKDERPAKQPPLPPGLQRLGEAIRRATGVASRLRSKVDKQRVKEALDILDQIALTTAQAVAGLGVGAVGVGAQEAVLEAHTDICELFEYASAEPSLEEGKRIHDGLTQILDGLAAKLSADQAPVNMVLWCPACARQHVDAPNPEKNWLNPPHKTHECQFCGYLWRVCDRPTNGVEMLTSAGLNDMPARPHTHLETSRAREASKPSGTHQET